jgi:hypothetical protein
MSLNRHSRAAPAAVGGVKQATPLQALYADVC